MFRQKHKTAVEGAEAGKRRGAVSDGNDGSDWKRLLLAVEGEQQLGLFVKDADSLAW